MKEYDAQLVGVYGRDGDPHFSMKDEKVNFGIKLITRLSQKMFFEKIFPITSPILKTAKDILEESRLGFGIHQEIMEVLEKGKLKIDLLINTRLEDSTESNACLLYTSPSPRD